MTSKIRPTRTDIRLIRECAERDASLAVVTLELGLRHNTVDMTKPESGNVLLVTNHPVDPTIDTDLADYAPWATFTRGYEAAEGGRGIFDFYVYERGPDRNCRTNVKAHYEGGKLVRITGCRIKTLWEAAA